MYENSSVRQILFVIVPTWLLLYLDLSNKYLKII